MLYMKKNIYINISDVDPMHRGAFCQFPFRWIYYTAILVNPTRQNAPLCNARLLKRLERKLVVKKVFKSTENGKFTFCL